MPQPIVGSHASIFSEDVRGTAEEEKEECTFQALASRQLSSAMGEAHRLSASS